MNNYDIENSITEAFEKVVPDMKDSILSDLEKNKKGKVLKMPVTSKKTNKVWTRVAAVAAALLLIVGAGFAIKKLIPAGNGAIATVMIDVNPSIELSVDSSDKVISAVPRNADGESVLSGMDLGGSDVKVAVNAIIGSMLRSGYLNELANSILITVSGSDTETENRLRDSLCADVKAIMDPNEFGYAVLSQTLEADPDTEALAEAYGMTKSKAQLIRKLIASNHAYAFSDLAALSINELGLLSGCNAVENLRSYGHSSDRAYIGEEAALAIALEHAGVSGADAEQVKIELDCEHGRMVYDIEFKAEGMEYDYEVDAVTGEIVTSESEPDDDAPRPTAQPPVQPTAAPSAPAQTQAPSATEAVPISSDAALAAALEHAGVGKKDAKDIEVELEREKGKLIYEVEFKAGGMEYDYDIDAYTGKVLSFHSEKDDDHNASPTQKPTHKPADPTQKPSQRISSQAALDIALLDAKVPAEEAMNVEVELKTRHGVKVYEVEFDHGKYEYDYLINAKTGEIIDRSREQEDDHEGDGHEGHGHDGGSLIGEAKAWEIALSKAGLKASQITNREIELDSDNGVRYYELEFECAGYEYEVKINAVTGAVMKFEKERGD